VTPAEGGSNHTPNQSWNQHRYLLAILRVLRVHLHQIALFQLDCDQDVRCGHESKEEVGYSHGWRAPECKKPTHVEGVSNDSTEKGRRKSKAGLGLPKEVPPNLPHPEQVEVADGKCGDQYQHPTRCEADLKHRPSQRILNIPDATFKRLPLPEQEQESNAASQNVGAALDCGR